MISNDRYKEIIRFLLAVNEADNICEEVLDHLGYMVPFGAAVYLEIGETGLLDGYYTKANDERGTLVNDPFFGFKDPVFDYGNRASGFWRIETDIYKTSVSQNSLENYYHTLLAKTGITEYLSFPIGTTGEGVRLYRMKEAPPFTEEEKELCQYISRILGRVVPHLRQSKERQAAGRHSAYVQKLLPFGYILFNKDMEPLMYNALAATRISDLTGEHEVDRMFRQFIPKVEELLHTALRAGREEGHLLLDNKYIVELLIRSEVDENGHLETYYPVCLYSSDWFRSFLAVSNETLFDSKLLTAREKEIAELIVIGKNAKEVADELHISVYTVKEHVKNIYNKFGVKNRAEFIASVYMSH